MSQENLQTEERREEEERVIGQRRMQSATSSLGLQRRRGIVTYKGPAALYTATLQLVHLSIFNLLLEYMEIHNIED